MTTLIKILLSFLGLCTGVCFVAMISVMVFRYMDKPEEFPRFNGWVQLAKRGFKL